MSEAAREATRADAGAIASLLREAFNEFQALYTPDAFAATVQSEAGVLIRLQQGPVWVVERGRRIAGTVAAVCDADGILVRGMAVHSSARGMGLGRVLLECVERFARERAVTRLFLYTTPFLRPAIRLYQNAGFQFTGETVDLHGVELLRMVKEYHGT